jgi:hypothetical protein
MTRLGDIMVVVEPPACLGCGRRLKFFAGLDTDLTPEPNDVSICMECGQIQIFDEDRFCGATKAEFNGAMDNPEFREAVLSARRVVARCKPGRSGTDSLPLLPPNKWAPHRALLPLGWRLVRQLVADCGELKGALGLRARQLIEALRHRRHDATLDPLHQMRGGSNEDHRRVAPAQGFGTGAPPDDLAARRRNDRQRGRRGNAADVQQGTQQARSKVSSVTAA